MTSTSGTAHARHTTATKITTFSSTMASDETATTPKDLTNATTRKTIPTTSNTKNIATRPTSHTATPQTLQKDRHLNTQDALTISIILCVGAFVLLMAAVGLLVFWRRNKYTVH